MRLTSCLAARNVVASGLRKAEDIVVGTAHAAGEKAEEAKNAAEPYTSNLMSGVKDTAATAEKKADEVAKQ